MAIELLLGLDVGTTNTKAAVVSIDGAELAHGSAPTPWRRVSSGAEIDPYSFVEAAQAAAREALAKAPSGRAVGTGVTSMAETGALLSRAGEPVVPAVAWHDARGERAAAELGALLGSSEFVVRTGLPLSPMCSLAKYRWMRANWPAARDGTRWLSVAEWVVHSLGGDAVAELSLASRTGMLDRVSGEWWKEALRASGAPPGLLPEPLPAGTPVGRVDSRFEDAQGSVLAVCGHDHLCASVGAGATESGDVFDSCGTAEAFVRRFDRPIPGEEVRRAVEGGVTVGWHVLPDTFDFLGGLRSGLVMQRFLRLLGIQGDGRLQQKIEAEALSLPPGAEGVALRDPWSERASITEIPVNAGPGHVWRAVIEAVQGAAARTLAQIESLAGPTRRLVVTGGGVRSELVRAVKREVVGPFVEPDVQEAGARGAALLAGLAAGVFSDFRELPAVTWKSENVRC